jgi:hypothetical protein
MEYNSYEYGQVCSKALNRVNSPVLQPEPSNAMCKLAWKLTNATYQISFKSKDGDIKSKMGYLQLV